ncbi:MAG: hypothetical protein DVB31_11695 [Verrucomicrobia bacterium]|nr:MAG: hypothetical protein DVB31_11695 [Verrucomicrobiota bacterium]
MLEPQPTSRRTWVRWLARLAPATIAAVLPFADAALAGALGPDPSFVAELESIGHIVDVAPYTNGTFLVCGDFHRIGGVRLNHVALLDAQGRPVPGFAAELDGDAAVSSVATQADGRILVAGSFPRVVGSEQGGVVRLLPGGRRDGSFRFAGAPAVSPRLGRVVLDPSGRIHLASYAGFTLEMLRLQPDGTAEPDPLLQAECQIRFVDDARPPLAHVLADGRFYLAGAFDALWYSTARIPNLARLVRMRPDGTPDPTFDIFLGFDAGRWGYDPVVSASALLPDGRLLVGGSFSEFNWHPRPGILIVNQDGSLNLDFRPRGIASASVRAVLPMPDGSVVAGGLFQISGDPVPRMMVRLFPDGSLDPAFAMLPAADSWSGHVDALAGVGDGRLAVVGDGIGPNVPYPGPIALLHADGSPTDGLPSLAVGPGLATRIQPMPDGTVYLSGLFHFVNGVPRLRFARLLHDGSVDTTFTLAAGNRYFATLAPLADGSLLLGSGSSFERPLLIKVRADGQLDPSFVVTTLDGSLSAILPLPDGDILVGGSFSGATPFDANPVPPFACAVARLGPDGTRRTNAFGYFGDIYSVQALLPEPDGGFLGVGGNSGLVRFKPDNTRDTSWYPNQAIYGQIMALARDSRGRVVAAGYFGAVGTNQVAGLVRMLGDGTIDTAFAPTLLGGGGAFVDVRVDAGDRVVALGSFSIDPREESSVSVVRLLANGSVDPSFPRIPQPGYAIALEGNNLYAGITDFSTPAEPAGRIVRYQVGPGAAPVRWTWKPGSRELALDAGDTAGTVHWEMSRDLKTWTAVPDATAGTRLVRTVSPDDAPLFFRTTR